MTYNDTKLLEANLAVLGCKRRLSDYNASWYIPCEGDALLKVHILGPYTTEPRTQDKYLVNLEEFSDPYVDLVEHNLHRFESLSGLLTHIANILAGERYEHTRG